MASKQRRPKVGRSSREKKSSRTSRTEIPVKAGAGPAGVPRAPGALKPIPIVGLGASMADVDSEYQQIDQTTLTTGEARTVNGVQAKFLRIKFVSATGGSILTAKILV